MSIITDKPPINNPTHLHSWSLYNIYRVQNNGWVLLGPMTKYVTVSHQRFHSVEILDNVLNIVLFLAQERIIQINDIFNQNGDDQTITVTE